MNAPTQYELTSASKISGGHRRVELKSQLPYKRQHRNVSDHDLDRNSTDFSLRNVWRYVIDGIPQTLPVSVTVVFSTPTRYLSRQWATIAPGLTRTIQISFPFYEEKGSAVPQ
jgi:hypothetical protein